MNVKNVLDLNILYKIKAFKWIAIFTSLAIAIFILSVNFSDFYFINNKINIIQSVIHISISSYIFYYLTLLCLFRYLK